jgi:hypothetical protein
VEGVTRGKAPSLAEKDAEIARLWEALTEARRMCNTQGPYTGYGFKSISDYITKALEQTT